MAALDRHGNLLWARRSRRSSPLPPRHSSPQRRVRRYTPCMITQLSIDRFKSMRSLSIPCRKVNVFIGAPDTGKTNILEALYFLSRLGWGWPLDTSLRLRAELGFDPLFYRQFFDQPFQISLQLVDPPAAHHAQQL